MYLGKDFCALKSTSLRVIHEIPKICDKYSKENVFFNVEHMIENSLFDDFLFIALDAKLIFINESI